MASRPDILFFFSDQHAQKFAGCYGDGLGATPNLDALAAGGVAFDNCYCAAPICTPSRMSLLTGRWPHEQSCWTLEDQLASDLPTYAHALGAAGYRTIQVGRMHSVGPDQHHGFAERILGECGPNWLGVARQALGVLYGTQGPGPHDADGTSISITRSGRGQSGYELADDAITEAAIARLGELGRARANGDTTPFMMGVGYVLPHAPFVARPQDYDRFAGRVGLPEIPRPKIDHPWIAKWRRITGTEHPPADAVIRARTAYYGLVHALDRKIGAVIAALRTAGLGENTLIVYSSDHGEQVGERDLWWKNTFYDESVKVPLILAWPGHLPQGERRAQVTSLVDVGATFIAAAGAPVLPRSRGRSLLSIAADPRSPWIEAAYSEYVTDLSSTWTGPEAACQRMLRIGRWKYVHMDGYAPQLFDLDTDPHELHDLAADPAYASVLASLRSQTLAGWDPQAIRSEVMVRTAEKAMLRDWGKATQPASPTQFMITDADSWVEGY